MRRALFSAILAVLAALPAGADQAAEESLEKFFTGWFSVCPGTRVSARALPEIAIPGYPAYRVERQCELKNRGQSVVALVDRASREVFVGEVLHSSERRGAGFAPEKDVPVLEGVLQDAYGVPASIEMLPGARGPLLPIRVALLQAPGATAAVAGFVSQDGATVLLGAFHPLSGDPAAIRESLLAASSGVRPSNSAFYVTAFIDFQCERCRARTAKVRDFVWTRGGALEIRFLPLVKVHDWAFAAAETAAALANISPSAYLKYEEAIFPRAGAMTAAGARELGADVADGAGVREAFDAELSSGRARQRVVRDIDLALSLGLNGTPIFFFRGAELTSDRGLAEAAIGSALSGGGKGAGAGSGR